MLVIPTAATQNQTVEVLLAGQNCQIAIAQKATGLFVDVYVNNALIIAGVIALDRNKIVRSSYLGFIGDLFFYDTHGDPQNPDNPPSDPTWDGLGSRYFLFYLEATDPAVPGPT